MFYLHLMSIYKYFADFPVTFMKSISIEALPSPTARDEVAEPTCTDREYKELWYVDFPSAMLTGGLNVPFSKTEGMKYVP